MEIASLREKARRRIPTSLETRRWAAWSRWLTLALIFVAVLVFTSPFLVRLPRTPERGSRASAPILAEASLRYLNAAERERWEAERLANHQRVYRVQTDTGQAVERRLDAILASVAAVRREHEATGDRVAALRMREPSLAGWTSSSLEALLSYGADDRFVAPIRSVIRTVYTERLTIENGTRLFADMRREVARLMDGERLLNRVVRESDVLDYPVAARAAAVTLLRTLTAESSLRDVTAQTAGRQLVELLLVPNTSFDVAATKRAYDSYPPPRVREYTPGTELAPAGATITDDLHNLLLAHRTAVIEEHRKKFIGHLLFVALAFGIIAFYVRKFSRELAFTSRTLWLLSLPVLLALATSYFFQLVNASPAVLAAGLFPAGAIGMLVVLLLDVRTALMLVTWGCLFFGLQSDFNYQGVIVGLLGGYTAVAALFTIRERKEVLVAGALIAAVNAFGVLLLDYIASPSTLDWRPAMVGAVAGFGCSLVTFAALPVFELAFDVTTDIRLLELSGLDQPLLRRLEEEAPGTWQHTLNVMKLAESATRAIGGNYLLVRTGTLYHDVGKLSKPEYFTENQVTAEDKTRHATLRPQISTLIVRNHVKEGIELARDANLPQRIVDFIPQHHGTSLIAYFYHKALGASERGDLREPVRQEDYRYPGPKPQSIEAAVVMLADSVEATATAKLTGRTVREDDIRQLVRTIVFDRFNDGQFDECNLTMRDLNIIRESFVRTLISRFHTRIDYPKAGPGDRPRATAPERHDSGVSERTPISERAPRNPSDRLPASSDRLPLERHSGERIERAPGERAERGSGDRSEREARRP